MILTILRQRFQFHKGAIKRRKDGRLTFTLLGSFNSIKVRLKEIVQP